MKILITGANGFVGKNLTEFLKTKPDMELYLYDRENTLQELERFCKDCDIVVNLAGVNRTENANEFVQGNLGVIEHVVKYLIKAKNKAPIAYSSSIQAELDNDYGKSKKMGEDFFIDSQTCLESGLNQITIQLLQHFVTTLQEICQSLSMTKTKK